MTGDQQTEKTEAESPCFCLCRPGGGCISARVVFWGSGRQGAISLGACKLVGALCIFQPGKISGRRSGAIVLGEVATVAPGEDRGVGSWWRWWGGRVVSGAVCGELAHFAASVAAAASCKAFCLPMVVVCLRGGRTPPCFGRGLQL